MASLFHKQRQVSPGILRRGSACGNLPVRRLNTVSQPRKQSDAVANEPGADRSLSEKGLARSAKYPSHNKRFHCTECDRGFTTLYSYKQHAAQHSHSIHHQKPFKCPECPKSFARAQYYKRHLVAVHWHERPHECTQCRRRFPQRSQLNAHAKFCGRVKVAANTLRCPSCRRYFDSKYDFVLHRLTDNNCEPPMALEYDATRAPSTSTVSSDSDVANRSKIRLDPNCATTFCAHDSVLRNKMVHSTTVDACASILDTRTLVGSIPDDDSYGGLEAATHASTRDLRRVYFSLSPAREGVVFPFSRYPLTLPGATPTKLLSLNLSMLLNPTYAMYYVTTIRTQSGRAGSYKSHIAVVEQGSELEEFFEEEMSLQRVEKCSNQILAISEAEGESAMATAVRVNGRVYQHSVVVALMGDLVLSDGTDIGVEDAVKIEFSRERVVCPASQCGSSYASIAGLKDHYRAAHTNVKVFSCDVCTATFSRKSTMETHRRLTHGHHGAASFVCPELACRKTFKTSRALVGHILVVHKLRDFSNVTPPSSARKRRDASVSLSEDCRPAIADASNRTPLQSNGTPCKTFVCPECGRTFAWRSNLNEHLLYVHLASRIATDGDLKERDHIKI